MQLGFKDEDIKFRDEVRAFIDSTLTNDMRKTLSLSKNGHAGKDLHIKWQKALYERGWMAPNWPVEYGGAGFTSTQKYIFESEMDEKVHQGQFLLVYQWLPLLLWNLVLRNKKINFYQTF